MRFGLLTLGQVRAPSYLLDFLFGSRGLVIVWFLFFCLFGLFLFLFLFARPRLHQPPLFRQPRHFLASRRGP